MGLPLPNTHEQDPQPLDKLLLWKMKRQLALTHPIYYWDVAASELSKPYHSPNGGEGIVTKLPGTAGVREDVGREGGWWQPSRDSPVPAVWGQMSSPCPCCRTCHL